MSVKYVAAVKWLTTQRAKDVFLKKIRKIEPPLLHTYVIWVKTEKPFAAEGMAALLFMCVKRMNNNRLTLKCLIHMLPPKSDLSFYIRNVSLKACGIVLR